MPLRARPRQAPECGMRAGGGKDVRPSPGGRLMDGRARGGAGRGAVGAAAAGYRSAAAVALITAGGLVGQGSVRPFG